MPRTVNSTVSPSPFLPPDSHPEPREQRLLCYPEGLRSKSAPPHARPCRTRGRSCSLASCSCAPYPRLGRMPRSSRAVRIRSELSRLSGSLRPELWLVLLQLALNSADDLRRIRLCRGLEATHWASVARNQKLGEVPLDVAT